MNDTTITLRGYLGGDVVLREAGDTHVASFRLGATPRIFNKATGLWADGTTQWFTVNAWRQLGLNVKKSVAKGDPVVVHGRLVAKEWADKDGVLRSTFEIDAEAVGHDLSRGTTMFVRPPRPQPQDETAEAPESGTERPFDPITGWASPAAA